jgi:hypothetical protein
MSGVSYATYNPRSADFLTNSGWVCAKAQLSAHQAEVHANFWSEIWPINIFQTPLRSEPLPL